MSTPAAGPARRPRAWSLALIVFANLAAMTLRFSATAVVPSMRAEAEIPPDLAAWFTGGVQIGFVAGTVVSVLLGLADRLDGRWLFCGSALTAAAANLAILALSPDSW